MRATQLPLTLLALLLLSGCDPDAPAPDRGPAFAAPDHFPAPTYDFERNPVTEAGFELGKRLFNDPRLSRDNTVSCASCHQQVVAFADPQHRLSVGVEERAGTRNAPGLFNLAFREDFLWDGGITHLDFVPINAIEAEHEMDEDLGRVVDKLRADPAYQTAFRTAFGHDTITSGLMLQALSQFQLMLVSDRSKYDDVITGRNGATFTPQEVRGEALFRTNCGGCHAGVLFTDDSFRNNGLATDPDPGRSLITESEVDRGKFRVPSLRNVVRTPPYMHDGRFRTLEEVLDHYREGITDHPALDPRLRNGIPLTEAETDEIIAFLQTLTDWELLSDERF